MKDGLNLEKFKGDNFSSWKMRFKSKMSLLNKQYVALFTHFEVFDREIVDSDFANSEGIVHEEKHGLSLTLKAYILCHCVCDPPYTLFCYAGMALQRAYCFRVMQVARPTLKPP